MTVQDIQKAKRNIHGFLSTTLVRFVRGEGSGNLLGFPVDPVMYYKRLGMMLTRSGSPFL